MKIMCDTNVIIDVLLEREPFIEDSYKVLKFCEEHKIDGFVSASSVTDIYSLRSEERRVGKECRL